MEQFEQRSYKTRLQASTIDAGEVHWFLDSLKLYDFPGTQIKVHLTSSSFLTPPALPAQQEDGHQSSLLADHRRLISSYLMPCNNSNQLSPSQQSATSAAQQQLRAALQSLREAVHTGLLQQRAELADVPEYHTWHRMHSSRAQSTAPAPLDLHGSSTDMLMNPQAPAAGGASDTLTSQGASQATNKTTAFLSAAETAFLSLDLTPLEGHQHYPFHFATYQVGQQVSNLAIACDCCQNSQSLHCRARVSGNSSTYCTYLKSACHPPAALQELPAAEWMQAVIRAGQFSQQLETAAQERELTAAYTSFALFAHAMLYTLFKMYVQTVAGEAKPHLALPSQEEVARMLKSAPRAVTSASLQY
jgi:hypothetical protein